MRSVAAILLIGCLLFVATHFAIADPPPIPISAMDDAVAWPAATNVTRPWTRWWWLGSAVDKENISRLLETYQAAGLGGVEITCIYGVRGAENRELPYLSEGWIDAVRHAVREAKRLGMQVDLPTGSGWRMGGPSVAPEDANANVVINHELLAAGSQFHREYPSGLPQAVVAYSSDGSIVDLLASNSASGDTAEIRSVDWTVPKSNWTLYTLTQAWSKDNVKRPAPGGEGRNINPLSKRSLTHYLDWFAGKLGDLPAEGIRCQFHDSYEYEGNWCDDFLAKFAKRRGYRLEDHLPALDGAGDRDEVARVKCDYRETVSDLVLENLIEPWTAWSHAHGMLARNQSHGSPANWLDIYAACDIPETESFGRLGGKDSNPLVWRFASSAAHVAGKPLVSAESCTWIDEHFNETLAEMKECVDRLFLAGVNHIIYHGTAYSPQDAAWPGWLFYAATELNPQNPMWRDLPALNEYVTRCQSVLQSTKPDNDILLYWPIHDYWSDAEGLRKDIRVHNSKDWFNNDFSRTAQWLDEHGYTFDYISDRQLAKCRVVDGRIRAPGSEYAMVLVPSVEHLPLETGRALVEIADAGGTIVSYGQGPKGTPGLRYHEEQAEFDALANRFVNRLQPHDGYRSATLGKGRIVLASDLAATLPALAVRRETWGGPRGLAFHRSVWQGGHVYFVKNTADQVFDGPIELADDWKTAVFMRPLGGRTGMVAPSSGDAKDSKLLRLQLVPGETMFVKTYRDATNGSDWTYREPSAESTILDGTWKVEFVDGGPELPTPITTQRLASWTELAGAEAERFAGTARYALRFTPDVAAERYSLDLGTVADSARVELNGKHVATLFASPFTVEISDLKPGENELVVEVTNVAANRIRDLDRRGVKWRIFKDINFVNINYKPFDASQWPVRPAGLLGPVTLTPVGRP